MSTLSRAAVRRLARRLYRDDLSRADEVPVEPDGLRAYDGWLRAATDAGDWQNRNELRAADRHAFAREWNRLTLSDRAELVR